MSKRRHHQPQVPVMLLAQARQAHARGDLKEATDLCLDILASSPPDEALRASALHLMGVVAVAQGKHERAVDLLRQALALVPASAQYHANLAVALDRLGVELSDPAIREEAVAEGLEAIRLNPDFVDALCNVGVILTNLGRNEEALPFMERAAALAPTSVKAIQGCAEALSNMGRYEDAEPYYDRWVATDPYNVVTWLKLGEYFAKQERWEKALEYCRKAYELAPTEQEVTTNLVAALSATGRNQEANRIMMEEIHAGRANAVTWGNLGCIRRKLGLNQSALDCYDQALEMDPKFLPAQWGRSLCLLALGRLEDGWADYECGMRTIDRQPKRGFPYPRWRGETLEGKTLLLWMEQGLGDHLAWASMIPGLLNLGAHVLVECEYRLVSLLQRSFPTAEVFAQTEPPHPCTKGKDIDYQIPGGSLPQYLRPSVGSFPAHGGFLIPDAARVAVWRDALAAVGPGPKVGVSWRSLRTQGHRSMDCMRLDQWGPILSIQDIHFVNLQCGWTQDELRQVGDSFNCRLHIWEGLDLKDDQDELAALMSNLDLTVTAFTVVAQLGGSIGAPVWALNHLGNQSWWNLGTDYCPWHPTIRFFPCEASEPWDRAIGDLARELKRRFGL